MRPSWPDPVVVESGHVVTCPRRHAGRCWTEAPFTGLARDSHEIRFGLNFVTADEVSSTVFPAELCFYSPRDLWELGRFTGSLKKTEMLKKI